MLNPIFELNDEYEYQQEKLVFQNLEIKEHLLFYDQHLGVLRVNQFLLESHHYIFLLK